MRGMTAQRRVSAGVPTGGQFARHDRDADTVTLANATATSTLTPADALRAAQLQARIHGGRLVISALDREDIAQDALVSVITSRANDRVHGLSPGLITNAVRHAVAAAVMQRTATLRHEDAKAMKLYRHQEELLTQSLGREPDGGELDSLAAHIRDTWPNPRHKPRVGFHRPPKVVPYAGAIRTEANSIAVPPEAETSELDDFADRVESGAISVAEAKRRLWDAVARAEALPFTRQQRRSATETRTLRRKLLAGGGAAKVAADYVITGQLTEQTMRLLEPFDVAPAERERIAALAGHLASRGSIAQRLWDAALESNAAA